MHVNSPGGSDFHAGLWRLQQDIGADPYSSSVPPDHSRCLVFLGSFLRHLPLGKCGPVLERLDSISGACQHRLGFVRFNSNDHLCSNSFSQVFFSVLNLTIKHQVQTEAGL